MNFFHISKDIVLSKEEIELRVFFNKGYNDIFIEFEFTGGFIKETTKIIGLFENERYKFNFNLNEKPKFEFNQWVNAKRMVEKLETMSIENLHGNIFVKSK